MKCKDCGKPVDVAIEGELRCQDCYSKTGMSDEEINADKDIAWFRTHCPDCEQTFSPTLLERHQGFCPTCFAEMQASL